MLKADAILFRDLASVNEAVQLAAASKLSQRPLGHFHDHPPGKFEFSTAEVESLISNWRATSHIVVRAWIAQALALVDSTHLASLPILAESLLSRLDGPYMPNAAQKVLTFQAHLPNSRDVLYRLHDHPDGGVRWRCAIALRIRASNKQLDDADFSLVKRLLLDKSGDTRREAVQILARIPGIGREEYGLLLEVENIDSGAARDYSRELMTKLEAAVPGCNRSEFPIPEPKLRTDGLYYHHRQELDTAGRWISTACLRFFPDGAVAYFGTDEAPALFPKVAQPAPERPVAHGFVKREGKNVFFSCEGSEGLWSFEGTIDADTIHLSGHHRETERVVQETYRFMDVEWDCLQGHTPPPTLPKQARPRKVKTHFIPLRPKSLTAADASKWYLQMMARLPTMLGDSATGQTKVVRAWEIKQQMRDSAASSLFDPDLKKEFYAKMPLPALEVLLALTSEEALRTLFTITPHEMRAFPGKLGEAIGMMHWDGENLAIMTEKGWIFSACVARDTND